MALKFSSRRTEEPEINLIAFIDILLVVLIFLMLSTTFSKFTELQLTLPTAEAAPLRDRPREVILSIAADGRYVIGKTALEDRSVDAIASVLAGAATAGSDTILIISADAAAPHQSVISAMEAARRTGLSQITFATQPATAGK